MALWTAQLLLAAIFLATGLTKLTQPRAQVAAGPMGWAADVGDAADRAIAELAGGGIERGGGAVAEQHGPAGFDESVAIALPIPDAAPVTTAPLPFSIALRPTCPARRSSRAPAGRA